MRGEVDVVKQFADYLPTTTYHLDFTFNRE